METVNIETLIEFKVLPFDIFDKDGNLILSAGDVLTPGKFIQLKHIEQIYKQKVSNEIKIDEEVVSAESEKKESPIIEIKKKSVTDSIQVPSVDDIDISNFNGKVNTSSQVDSKTQIRLQAYHQLCNTQKDFNYRVRNYQELRNKITDDISVTIPKVKFLSELVLLGEYETCHAVNVAILSNTLGLRLGLEQEDLNALVLAALLHDIGKEYLPKEIKEKSNLTRQELEIFEKHTILGYNVIKKKLNLPDKIARPALQHHEYADGTGYPMKISEDSMSLFSHIIAVCNCYSDLIANKTPTKIRNGHEALKYIIQNCTKLYRSDIMYTFVHMFSYNDTQNFEDMVV